MEYVIGIILGLIGLVYFQSSKKKDAQAEALIADTKGQDKQLEKQEINIKEEIQAIDAGIEKLKAERAEQIVRQDDEKTLAERAKEARAKFGKKPGQ